ncbi:unnamed protein product [Prorocentrum cordatum]|uniref:Uncharacterized protein n=1 Tax=Prorocentrum cordatum TaxID=2364126 RepID=A0ABN9XMY3_9DINO|nr:unnamed protein product [Polarella glacialis]
MEAGLHVGVPWQAGRDWQVSIIICERSGGEYTVGDPAPPALVTKWFCCLTPDGDILLHLLAVGALAGVVVLDKTGQPTDSTSEGQKSRRRHSVCGADREAMALDYVAALRFCRPEALSSGHPSRRLRGKQLRPASGTPSGDGAAKVPTDMEVSEGALPTPPDGQCGGILATTGSDTARTERFGGATDGYAVAGGFGVVPMGLEADVVRGVKRDELGGDGDSDARSFNIKVVFEGERCRLTKDAVNLLSEASWPVRPVLGPHTTRRCLPFLADQDLCMRVVGLGMSFDQLNDGELGFFEYIARRAQLIEHCYRERAMDRPDGIDGAEDDYLMMGTLETRGHLKIAPELQDYITAELHLEAGLFEERRELREERAISACPAGSSAGMVVARELLPINLAALSAPREPPGVGRCSRSVRSRALRRTLVDERVRESVTALNLLYNHGEAQVSHQLSLAQVRGVEHLRRGWERLGAPEVSPAAACSELCGSRPGYGDPVKTAPYQRDLVSLPTGGVLAEGDRCLGGAALSFWKEWRQHLLRPGVSREVVQKFRPHVDSRLRAKGTYAQFVLDLQAAGLVNLRGRLDATLGVFFAWKSDGVRQRLVQDRRAAAGLEEGPLAAVYVDGVAFLGASEKCCSDGCASAVELLGSRGLVCKGMVGASEQQSFTGLTFERSSGIISLSTRRLWKIRLGLLELCRQGWCTGVQLRRVLGHLTWAFLLKRELLSILSSAFRFCEMAGEQRWRLWSCVTRELRIAAALLPFAAVDTKRPFDPCVMASDASGATEFDFGGFGVCERPWDSEAVRAVASRAERWRYCVEDAICAREQSLGLVPQGPSKPRSSQVRARRGVTDFFHIDGEQIGDFDTWSTVLFGRFASSENIMRAEGRALVMGARHKLRNVSSFGLEARPARALQPALPSIVSSSGPSCSEPADSLQLRSGFVVSVTVSILRAAAEGLTLPQTSRAGHGTQLQYQRPHTDFLGRSRGEKLRMSTVANLDRGLASYLDHLIFDGWIRGFSAIIGAGVCCGLLDCCLGLLVAWDARLRLASASIGMMGGSLVTPARRSRIDRWTILLFPKELPDRSKTGQFEEGVVLESDAVQCVSSALNALKLRSQADRPLWPSSSPRFRQEFAACASLEGLEDVPPYQDRHGADSHDVLFQVGEFGAVQEKSRHLNESRTRRCRKGTRYLATDEKLSPEIKAFGEWVEANLAGLFSGRPRCLAPPGRRG